MCKGSRKLIMEGEKFEENQTGFFLKSSILLELAAKDDVSGFVSAIEVSNKGFSMSLDEVSFWYGRRNGCKGKMGFEERTPLMLASVYGSIHVLKYLISTKSVDINKCSDSDGATALHCAAAGGSSFAIETVKALLEAGADLDLTDDNGNKASDLIARGIRSSKRKALEMLLSGFSDFTIEEEEEEEEVASAAAGKKEKEYPVDVTLPDINDGVYGSDEFRMFMFKVKPCSRAYSHDWTECPFVHPGENARRRDPRKHQYTCVPCPEFRKGSCVKGDNCEYAHGVFESWLHPAQYRTRLCKDETGCARKVCFFAHKIDELRPLYASTGSAVPSPKSSSSPMNEIGSVSPLGLNSTPPMSPSLTPVNGNSWQNKFVHVTPPALQLPGSRLKTSLNARDLEMEIEFLQRQQMIDQVYASSSSPSNPLRATFPSSPVRNQNQKPATFGYDSSAAVAQAVMNSRSSSSFSKQRSQSFIDRGAVSHRPASYSEWGSPDGKLEWGFNSEEVNKLRKSASFGFRSGSPLKSNHGEDEEELWSSEKIPQWVEQMYIDQQQLMAK